MGSTINLSETLIMALGSMAIVLAILILFAISLVIRLSKMTADSQSKNNDENNFVQIPLTKSADLQASVQSFNDSDDEDKLVAVLAASALTAQSRPDSHFRVSKITRIK